MRGFSAEWLSLREPVDHRSRNRDVLAATARRFSNREEMAILDLGSGSGSNLRGLAPHLTARQRWQLLDHDPGLLDAAKTALSAWADTARPEGDRLGLERNGILIDVGFRQTDLARDLSTAFEEPVDLVTAAAFFDLVSPAWIERFVALVADRGLPVYTVLIYDGREKWLPAHPADEAVNAAFNAHQRSDKGFGVAAGPDAAGLLAQALRGRGYEVILGQSPWRLTPSDLPLIEPLADGIAAAIRETPLSTGVDLDAWREAHRLPASCTIGHTDLVGLPPRNQRDP